jgi:hypothetical protein
MTAMNQPDPYREHLVKTRQKSQTEYDKAILLLSGGALAVTISFVRDIVGGRALCMPLLFIAWFFWGLSCASVLYSHYSSVVAHNEAIAAYDQDGEPDIASNKLTKVLNLLSGGLFLLGLLAFCLFAYVNI